MSWSLANSKNNESAKIRWELVPYLRGRVLDVGCGAYKAFPQFIGVDNGHHWGMRGVDIRSEASDLSLLASNSCDTCYSSHLIEHVNYKDVPAMLSEWFRVTKHGGHVIVYAPDEDEYPKVGDPYANTDHKWKEKNEKFVEALEQVPCNWDMIDFQKRNQNDEYSLFFVVKKL